MKIFLHKNNHADWLQVLIHHSIVERKIRIIINNLEHKIKVEDLFFLSSQYKLGENHYIYG